MKRHETQPSRTFFGFAVDLFITLLLWTYFTLGFIIFFSGFYLCAVLFSKRPEASFQRLNRKFCKGFFILLRVTSPRHQWDIDNRVLHIRSSVIVCNHVSYLDPLVLVSLFEKHTTVVKGSLFRVPVFGTMLRRSGYLPSSSGGRLSASTIQQIETMADYLATGGNLFIFPEGTRSRNGTVATLNAGAFKIARLCRAPINIIAIRNTNKLFQPGRFLFNTRVGNIISVELIEKIEPDYEGNEFSLQETMARVQKLLCSQAAQQTL